MVSFRCSHIRLEACSLRANSPGSGLFGERFGAHRRIASGQPKICAVECSKKREQRSGGCHCASRKKASNDMRAVGLRMSGRSFFPALVCVVVLVSCALFFAPRSGCAPSGRLASADHHAGGTVREWPGGQPDNVASWSAAEDVDDETDQTDSFCRILSLAYAQADPGPPGYITIPPVTPRSHGRSSRRLLLETCRLSC
jgi:hypothetical protein